MAKKYTYILKVISLSSLPLPLIFLFAVYFCIEFFSLFFPQSWWNGALARKLVFSLAITNLKGIDFGQATWAGTYTNLPVSCNV